MICVYDYACKKWLKLSNYCTIGKMGVEGAEQTEGGTFANFFDGHISLMKQNFSMMISSLARLAKWVIKFPLIKTPNVYTIPQFS